MIILLIFFIIFLSLVVIEGLRLHSILEDALWRLLIEALVAKCIPVLLLVLYLSRLLQLRPIRLLLL